MTMPSYDSTSVRIGGVEVMHPRIGSREDMFNAIVQAVWDLVNERLPFANPTPDPEVVRRAAWIVVESMEPKMEPVTTKPGPVHWQRLLGR